MINQIIVTALFIWGIYFATRCKYSQIEQKFTRKEILWFVKWYGDEWLPEWARKPLYDCPMCMSSVWSFLLGGVYFGLSVELIIIIPAVCGLNYILDRIMYSED